MVHKEHGNWSQINIENLAYSLKVFNNTVSELDKYHLNGFTIAAVSRYVTDRLIRMLIDKICS